MISWIVLFPLIGFGVNGFWYTLFQAPRGMKKAGATATGIIGSAAILSSFVVSLGLFLRLKGMPEADRLIEETLFTWMRIGIFQIDLALRLDPLSSLFTLVITGVGALIHLYSIGYMSHDATPGKFFAFLNLFCFAMLMLVLGSSLPVLFLGWEGVGLCSYLLIGYWYTDMAKAVAGKKAFIVNRVGDLGFLLGMFLAYSAFGTLDFNGMKQAIHLGGSPVDLSVATAICLLLFVGCIGKSAQLPLYVWLPDAMAGPTPVSALIHAATMVTSGIYLVSRMNFLYDLSPVALEVVAVVGAVTAFFAATVAFAQRDIKKVLAYSTISQLGYMFLGCGVGAYGAGVFHVVTHAFFKALLFLGAGSVIHGMHEEQDIFKMGGLRTRMPKTFATFAVGWIAICGIPPFSGFFSKDEILWMTYSSPHGSRLLWFLGLVTAAMTAFYMTRLFALTFLGKERFGGPGTVPISGKVFPHPKAHGPVAPSGQSSHSQDGVHESPAVMWIPLAVLAGLSAVGGFIGIPHFSWIEHWLSPVLPPHVVASGSPGAEPVLEWVLMAVSVGAAALGMHQGLGMYRDLERAEELRKRFAGLHRLVENKWYVDELYEAVVAKPIYFLSVGLWKGLDVAVIDRLIVGLGRASLWTGQTVRVLQTGSLQVYALMILAGILAVVGCVLYGMA